jgi:poly-gamma-glutamate system protein
VIGEEYTPITTDQARLSTKLLSANPNFAAVVVELLSRARLKQGDKVAVALTGSLPGLNLAVLAAIEALGLRPVIITSVGASMWGANDPEFTWLDMERVLFERGVIRHRSQAASIGSGGDSGQGLSPEGRDLIRGAIRRNGVILIEEPRLSLSIRRRVILYDSLGGAGQPHAYVNVGGGLASLGSTANGKVIPPGLSRDLTLKEFPSEGVITLLARRRIPIIHLMEIEKLADLYGLPLDPDLDQPVGQGRVYLSPRYSVPVVLVCAVVLVVVTLAFVHIDLRYYLGRLIKRTPGAESPTSRHPSETSG